MSVDVTRAPLPGRLKRKEKARIPHLFLQGQTQTHRHTQRERERGRGRERESKGEKGSESDALYEFESVTAASLHAISPSDAKCLHCFFHLYFYESFTTLHVLFELQVSACMGKKYTLGLFQSLLFFSRSSLMNLNQRFPLGSFSSPFFSALCFSSIKMGKTKRKEKVGEVLLNST
mmetsp:Transcript_4748/g.9533  ORF Transcript_4748/g.9533 Transcript_4748/m.9533 type:complete len:176 (-) Transcript_4748:500-1027(-)